MRLAAAFSVHNNMTRVYRLKPQACSRIVEVAVLFSLAIAANAHDHNGPPLRLIAGQRAGPYIVSLWAHAIVGKGKLFIGVEPAAGGRVPDDLKVEIGIEPLSGRLPERHYAAYREPSHGQAQFQTEANFDVQESWRVRVLLQSILGTGEALATVEATPMGPARWAILLYLMPFVAVGYLWLRVMIMRRRLEQV